MNVFFVEGRNFNDRLVRMVLVHKYCFFLLIKYGFMAFLKLADLQWMCCWQIDLLGCIFGEIIAIAGECTSNN